MPACHTRKQALEGRINIRKHPRGTSLRIRLREATSAAHEVLDDAFDPAAFGHAEHYARFLQFQHAARRPVEDWLDAHCPPTMRPPASTVLLESDLRQMGLRPADPTIPCQLHAESDPLGVSWVLAGSSMGNRAMLAAMARSGAQAPSTHFLSDPAMPQFWQELRPLLERPVTQDEAARTVSSANATFAMFAAGLRLVQGEAA